MRLPRVIATACADPAPKQSSDPIGGRAQFMTYAARAMRGLLIDYIRARRAEKRGGEITFVAVSDRTLGAPAVTSSIERLGHALDELGQLDPALAELVDLKFFCGFSFSEIAAMRGVSSRTVERDWAKARVLLHDALQGDMLSGSEP